jgi:hypothetical protein
LIDHAYNTSMSKLDFFQTSHPRWWTLEETYQWFLDCHDPEARRAYGRASVRPQARSYEINQFVAEAEHALLNGQLKAYASFNGGPIQLLHEWEWTRLSLSPEPNGKVLSISIRQPDEPYQKTPSEHRKGRFDRASISHFVIDGRGVKETWRQRRFDRKRELVENRRGPKKTVGALIESALERFEFKGMNVSASRMGCSRTDIAKAMITFLNKNYPAPKTPYKVPNVVARLNSHWERMKIEAAEIQETTDRFRLEASAYVIPHK